MRKRNEAKIARWRPPASGLARPGTTVSTPTTTERKSSTISVLRRPSASGPSSQIEAMAMVGMVRPIDAIALP